MNVIRFLYLAGIISGVAAFLPAAGAEEDHTKAIRQEVQKADAVRDEQLKFLNNLPAELKRCRIFINCCPGGSGDTEQLPAGSVTLYPYSPDLESAFTRCLKLQTQVRQQEFSPVPDNDPELAKKRLQISGTDTFSKVSRQIPRRFVLDSGSFDAEGRCVFYGLAPGGYTIFASGVCGQTSFCWVRHVHVNGSVQVILDNDQCIISEAAPGKENAPAR